MSKGRQRTHKGSSFFRGSRARIALAIGTTVLVAGGVTWWGVYRIEEYGVAMFVLTPLLIGLSATVVYGYGRTITLTEASRIAFSTLCVFLLGLVVFAMEGMICIAMAAPIVLLFTFVGAWLGKMLLDRMPGKSLLSIGVLAAAIPSLAITEGGEPRVAPVVTSVIIDARPEEVWEQVVAFPRLTEPDEFLFRAGISYPIEATIDGEGVGAVRHCTFNTGSFVEPITVWDPPHLLAFDVEQQPAPLRELSFWDIDAPHLHDTFVSQRGQFRLTALPDGRTKLEGTTWYYHDIRPDFYWRWWSDYIIHRIHERVLEHIKLQAEG